MAEGVAVGDTVQVEEVPTEWNSVIANNVNDIKIQLVVDANVVSFYNEQMFMDDKMNIMIPTSVFTEAFKCSFNYYDNGSVLIKKGNTELTVQLEQNYMHVGDVQIQVPSAMLIKDGMVYLQAKVVELGLGYTYKWDIASNTLYLTDSKKGDNILPSKFSYRDIKKIPEIKNQGNLSTCWAFAALSALESRLMPEQKFSFSVDNMSFNNGYVGNQSDGGDYTRAIAYLTAWKGPVLESDDPYGDGIHSSELKPVKHVQEVQIIDSKNFEAIKKAVFMYGGVESSLYSSMASSNESSVYYNKNNYSYCYIGTQKPNHDVVIVGWDDNYSKSNFNGNLEGDGAFICMNSWGANFGDGGLFYISYYDSNIGMHNVVYTGVASVTNYDNIYQSDLCGWVGQMGYEGDTAYFSNVYTANSEETLKAVSFYATGKATEYEIYFVDNYQDTSSFDNKVFVKKGTFTNAGYYTVDLDKSYDLQKGNQYGVVIKIKTPNSIHPIAVEYRAGAPTAEVDLSDGNGYISLSGKSWEHVEESKNCNICLKMFTINR
ncbi:Cysteine protease, C1A family [[Clostridium] fimetarium]|uniref:Cysteine protease, C1A family n=2 Tax=[Clostridium] fimetarium TaxID=99656 RepID=A0A1I0RWT1_9FIRM|nr:Cysteine protease, C1A family [[Clostridium] fimetarium]